jgi:hypothetical protein
MWFSAVRYRFRVGPLTVPESPSRVRFLSSAKPSPLPKMPTTVPWAKGSVSVKSIRAHDQSQPITTHEGTAHQSRRRTGTQGLVDEG